MPAVTVANKTDPQWFQKKFARHVTRIYVFKFTLKCKIQFLMPLKFNLNKKRYIIRPKYRIKKIKIVAIMDCIKKATIKFFWKKS